MIAEYNTVSGVNINWQKNDVYLGERLLATESTAIALQFHHPDRLGTRLVTNASDGSSAGEQETLPFGTALGAGISGNQRRFTSYDSSTTTNLDYAVNRTYNAGLGRFTQVDPIELEAVSLSDPQSLNLYAYCGNDPINHTDPDGLFFKKLFGWIGTALNFIFKVAAVIVAIIAVMALGAIGQYWGSILITKGLVAALFASSALLATAGWAPGKVGQVASALILGGLGWQSQVRTPTTFPSTGVGGVVTYVQPRGGTGGGGRGNPPRTPVARMVYWARIIRGIIRAPARFQYRPLMISDFRTGFGSFQAFKNAVGPATPVGSTTRYEWHHIVEQTSPNTQRFMPQRIHHPDNLVRVEYTLHRQISGYYSSVQPFTNGMTVRAWLSTQTYEQQFMFGVRTMHQFGIPIQ